VDNSIYCVYKASIVNRVNTTITDAGSFPRILRAAYLGMHRLSDAHFSRFGVTADQFVLLAVGGIAARGHCQRNCVHGRSRDE
jgi:hypothetical protein